MIKDNKFKDIINSKIKDVRDILNVKLNPDDPSLIEQITLGNRWDDPSELSKSLDMHPLWYARWAFLSKKLKNEVDRLQSIFNAFESNKKIEIRDILVERRKKNGLTDKQAILVTQTMVDDKFRVKYNYENEIYKKYRIPLDHAIENYDNVTIIVDAFKQRKDLLVVLGYLVKSMIENNLLSINKKRNKKYQ